MSPTPEAIVEWVTVFFVVTVTLALTAGMVGGAVYLFQEWRYRRRMR